MRHRNFVHKRSTMQYIRIRTMTLFYQQSKNLLLWRKNTYVLNIYIYVSVIFLNVLFSPLFQVSPFYQADFSSILNTLLRGALYTFDTRNARLRVHNEWVRLFFCNHILNTFLWLYWIRESSISCYTVKLTTRLKRFKR